MTTREALVELLVPEESQILLPCPRLRFGRASPAPPGDACCDRGSQAWSWLLSRRWAVGGNRHGMFGAHRSLWTRRSDLERARNPLL